jgi:hypothetical protein
MTELGGYARAAVVVEAQYADLTKPGLIGRWPASHLLRVVGELAAMHPRVPLVFAGNRKLANAWTQRFFASLAAVAAQTLPDLVREPLLRFEPAPLDGGTDTRIRVALLQDLPDGFAIADLRTACPDVPDARLRRVLAQVRREGRLRREGAGRGVRWHRTPAGGAATDGGDAPEVPVAEA